MLLFEFLERQVGGRLIVTHVVVPCLRELEELSLLRSLNILQLLLLRGTNGVALSDGLLAQQLIELSASLLGLLIVLLDLALLTVLLEQSQEINDLIISRYIDDTVFGRCLAQEILPVKVVWVILRELVLHLLHHLDEVVETDTLIILNFTARIVRLLVALLILLSITDARRPNLLQQHLGLDRVPVQRLHDSLEVRNANSAVLLAIEKFEDLAQMLNFLLRELHVIATVLLLLIHLLFGHGSIHGKLRRLSVVHHFASVAVHGHTVRVVTHHLLVVSLLHVHLIDVLLHHQLFLLSRLSLLGLTFLHLR